MSTARTFVGSLVGAAAILLFTLAPVAAQPLPKPKERAILEVTGKITVTNGDNKATFDLAMLESLGITKTKTSTAWTEGQPQFELARV